MSEGVDQANDPQIGGTGTDRNEELTQAQTQGGERRDKSALLQQAEQDAGLATDTNVEPDAEALEEADRSV